MENHQNIKITDFDPKYLDQHVEIRDMVVENLPFRTKVLQMEKDELETYYSNDLMKSSQIVRYAVRDDQLLGFVSVDVANSILMKMQIEGIDQSVDLSYPMVREGEKQVIPLLLDDIKKTMAARGFQTVECAIGKGNQYADEIIDSHFDFQKPIIQNCMADLSKDFDLPSSDNIRTLEETDLDQIKQGMLAFFKGIPEEKVDEELSEVVSDLDKYPALVMEEDDKVIGYISVEETEDEGNMKVRLPFIDMENYDETALKLFNSLFSELKKLDNVSTLTIPQFVKPDVLEALKEAGVGSSLMLGQYQLKMQ